MTAPARPYRDQIEVGDKTLALETGMLGQQANGAVVLRYGDTVVLVTAVMGPPRDGLDFFPLTVDFEERLYAAGRIPGSFFRREGRPSTPAILTARLTDRSIRPRFPKGMRQEVQVICTVLSADQVNPSGVLSIIGASAALSISSIPFDGPISGTVVGYVDGRYVVNPSYEELAKSTLEITVSGGRDAVIMVEAGAQEVSEEVVLEAISVAQAANRQVIEAIDRMVAEVGRPKVALPEPQGPDASVSAAVSNLARSRLEGVIDRGEGRGERSTALEEVRADVHRELSEEYGGAAVAMAYDELLKDVVRSGILHRGKRPDGRRLDEVRPLASAVGLLPRTHGTGLFQRGETHVLTVATLGSLTMVQKLDTLDPEASKRYFHHYNFPPFSTGEAKRVGSPGRREIGHGALAERALEAVIPSEEEFPYTIRLVSEVLSSNGSTSMASVCGSTLALMDAGVPIKAPVSGVAMGLIAGEGDSYAVLTDIQGVEDFMGDMDFKVAGTARGVTALQMDIKVSGLSHELMHQALHQARMGRAEILDHMLSTISSPRSDLSPYAPRMIRLQIPVDKIGAVIGPGGKTIRGITEQMGVTIDVESDGSVTIGSMDGEAAQRAIQAIEALTKEVVVGDRYMGKVVRLMSFGAFVEILPGKEGLVHVSELSDHHVPSVEAAVSLGDELEVMVTEIDRVGRINLSRRAVLQGLTPSDVPSRSNGRGDRSGDRRGRPDRPGRRPEGTNAGPRDRGPRGPRRFDA